MHRAAHRCVALESNVYVRIRVQAVLRDLPNSKLYLDHRELDLKIEQYSNRTKADICDVYQHSDLAVRCLRLQLYNRHYHQVRPPSHRLPASNSVQFWYAWSMLIANT